MPKQPLAVTAYQHDTLDFANNRLVNMFAEIAEGQAREEVILRACPGQLAFSDTGEDDKENRGMVVHGGVLYAVLGEYLYSVSSGGTATRVSTLPIAGEGQCTLRSDDSYIVITTTETTDDYVYDTTNGLRKIATANFAGSVDVDILDGFFIHVIADPAIPGRFQWSDLRNPESYQAANFANAEAKPDALRRVLVAGSVIWFFGDRTIEPWISEGGTPQFRPFNDQAIEIGLAATRAIAKLENDVYFLGAGEHGSLAFYELRGGVHRRVSTTAIEKVIGSGTYSDAQCFAYEDQGHKFVVLTLPSIDRTFCYDATTGLWHERQSGVKDKTRWKVRNYVYCYGKHLVGHETNGKIYELDLDTYTDDGESRLKLWTVQTESSGEFWNRMDKVQMLIESGVGPVLDTEGVDDWSIGGDWAEKDPWGVGAPAEPREPQLMMKMYDMHKGSWGKERWRGMGKAGQRHKRLSWRGLGRFIRRLLQFSTTEDVKTAAIRCNAAGQPGSRVA